MWWLLLAILGTLSGFALHQLAKNYLANKILCRASPLSLGVAVDKLITVCSSYVKLVEEANKLVGVLASPTNFLVSSHIIYSLSMVRNAVTSLTSSYLVPGHSEYQVYGLRYWLVEVYPTLFIVATFSKDSSQIKELRTEDNKELIAIWQENSDIVIGLLERIKEFIENGIKR